MVNVHKHKQRALRGVSDELWAAFAAAVAGQEPRTDRSEVLREFIRWYVGEPDARQPRRPRR